jgi:DNA polymerase III alpha subunit
MAFMRVKDLDDSLECVVFPKTFVDVRRFCQLEMLVVIKGKMSDRNGEPSMIVNEIKELK